MTRLLVLLALPCLFWTQGPESAPALKQAGIDTLCVAPERADAWKKIGVSVTPLSAQDLAAREALPPPGTVARPGLASPTRVPWVTSNAWHFVRNPAGKFRYELPAGKAAIAAAEAFAYGGDVVLQIDPADLSALGGMFQFFAQVPQLDPPPVADFGVVDDGTPEMGEVLNLFIRRNLLFKVLPKTAQGSPFALNVALGTKEYPRADAADPSAFALKIRHQLTDDKRSLRLYGSEVVIARLTGDASRARVHLLNYAGRDIQGLRVRVRGSYPTGQAYIAGTGRVDLLEQAVVDGATEFSVPSMTTYAVIDLSATKK